MFTFLVKAAHVISVALKVVIQLVKVALEIRDAINECKESIKESKETEAEVVKAEVKSEVTYARNVVVAPVAQEVEVNGACAAFGFA